MEDVTINIVNCVHALLEIISISVEQSESPHNDTILRSQFINIEFNQPVTASNITGITATVHNNAQFISLSGSGTTTLKYTLQRAIFKHEVTWAYDGTGDIESAFSGELLGAVTETIATNKLPSFTVWDYDADALNVFINIDIENETISIEDNGKGMNSEDFGFYLRIAGKDRKKKENTTDLGRKIIGQFGVGFLSVFPFFKNYSIESSKSGSERVLHAQIPLSNYFDVSTGSLDDVDSIRINGGELNDSTKKAKSFTKIKLNGFNDLTKSFFKSTIDIKVNEVETFSGIEKLKWILSDDLPILFKEEKFNNIFDYPENQRFDVHINGQKLYRGVYGKEILETHKGEYSQIGNIKFRYFISTPRKAVSPREARFLKIRNLNVGVGDEREDFSKRRGGTRSRLHWLTGELHIIEGMNNLIRVSRDDFNYSRDFEDLKDFFNSKLQHYSTILEKESELKREISQTGKDFRIQNINLLNPEHIKRKIKKLEEEGFEIRTSSNSDSSKNNIIINEEKKEIQIDVNLINFEKHIIIKKNRYLVKSDSWNYDNDLFPACKIVNNSIIINSNYPLFKGLKFTDIFVKMHLLLLMNFKDSSINETAYRTLTKDILIYYSDY